MRKTQKLAITALMASLALALSVMKVELPFPVLPYLKFDFAELPSTLVYFMCGLPWGLATATLHLVGMLARGADPLGALFKFLAVASTLVGLSTFSRLSQSLAVLFAGATLARVVAMTAANWLYFTFLFPKFLDYAVKVAGGLVLLYAYTALFNVLHVALSLLPSWSVFVAVKKRLKLQ